MFVSLVDLATFSSGGLVGANLGLIGGGSGLAVPLLVYGVGVSPPHRSAHRGGLHPRWGARRVRRSRHQRPHRAP
jgi:uncharacterized membrane protein YfcA